MLTNGKIKIIIPILVAIVIVVSIIIMNTITQPKATDGFVQTNERMAADTGTTERTLAQTADVSSDTELIILHDLPDSMTVDMIMAMLPTATQTLHNEPDSSTDYYDSMGNVTHTIISVSFRSITLEDFAIPDDYSPVEEALAAHRRKQPRITIDPLGDSLIIVYVYNPSHSSMSNSWSLLTKRYVLRQELDGWVAYELLPENIIYCTDVVDLMAANGLGWRGVALTATLERPRQPV